MEILLLIIGIIIGTVVGYLAADRKSAALKAEISGTKKEIELLKLQKEEAEALHKRMNIEFENLSNRIFQSKAEDFTKLNAEHLGNLLRPLGDNLKTSAKRWNKYTAPKPKNVSRWVNASRNWWS